MNLLADPWLPIIRLSGKHDVVPPSGIVGPDPAVALDLPRADFSGAMLEFLIGILTTAYAPASDAEWVEQLFSPPSPSSLTSAFSPYFAAFAIDGDGPRFMQDLEAFESRPRPIASLLMDQPGEQGRERNTDLFVRGDAIRWMSRGTAAMALYTLQTYAPSGGKGYRVSLRGGGPLSTLVDLTGLDVTRLPPTLWTLVWGNVLARQKEKTFDPETIFPWLTPTRTSEKDQAVAPDPVTQHVAAFWGMPRRIRLMFEPAEGRTCDVLPFRDAVLATSLTTVGHGPKYEKWIHPLSPYKRKMAGEPMLPFHAQPGGIRYREWPSFACFEGSENSQPAGVVIAMQGTLRRNALLRRLGARPSRIALRAFGYDMDNMKARCWYEARMPIEFVDPNNRRAFDAAEFEAVKLADVAARAVLWEIKCARVDRPKELRGNFGDLEDAFWRSTEDAFRDLLQATHARIAAGERDLEREFASWKSALRKAALDLFDCATPTSHEVDAMKRVVSARMRLGAALRFDSGGEKKRRSRAREDA